MKIYFTSSISGLEKFRPNCERISEILKQQGHTVHDVFLHISKEEDREKTAKESKYLYKYITQHVNESDIFIAEMSYRSAPVSYQLTYALEHSKPSLYLVEKERGSPPHGVFRGNPSRYLMISKYTMDTLEKVLLKFLTQAKKLLMRRFNFLLPAQLDEYISVRAAFDRMSKGEFVRALIESQMKQDTQFRQFLSGSLQKRDK